MGVVSKPYTFSPGTLIQSAQVNADFDTLYTLVNGNLDATNILTIMSAHTFANKGSVSFAGGFILNWDNGIAALAVDGSAATAVTFLTAFPNACLLVLPHMLYDASSLHVDYHCVSPIAGWTVTGATIWGFGGDTGTTAAAGYLALGY